MNRIQRLLGPVRRYGLLCAYVLLSAAIVCWVSWEAFYVRAITYSPNADYWEHSGVLRALLDSPFRPKTPHLGGTASSPRFGPQVVLVALLGRALHLDALATTSVSAIFNVLLLVLGIYAFFRTFFRSQLAPLYGLLVLFTSWWHAWPFSNVYQLDVLVRVASYPSTAALGLSFLGFAATERALRIERRSWPNMVVVALWAGCVLIIHPLTAVLAASGAGLLTLTEPRISWRRRFEVMAALASGLFLASFWPYFSPWLVIGGGESDSSHWISESLQQAVQGKTVEQPHRWYNWREIASSLGLALLGALSLPYFFLERRRLFVSVGAVLLVLLFTINYFVEIPLGHRYILLATFYLQVAVVWVLLKLTPGSSEAWPLLDRPWRKAVAAALIVCVLSPFVFHNLALASSESEVGRRTAARRESYYVIYARMAAQLAGPNAVILASPLDSWPIPMFGPKVVALLHPNTLVPDEPQRTVDVHRFLNKPLSLEERRRIIDHYRVTHVLLRGQPRGQLAAFLAGSATEQNLTAGYRLYTLNR